MYNGSLETYLNSINVTAINETITERLKYINLSDFWRIKEPVESLFGSTIYFLTYFLIIGLVMIKTRSFAPAAYVGILLGIAFTALLPPEVKPMMFGMVVMFVAGVILSAVLRR